MTAQTHIICVGIIVTAGTGIKIVQSCPGMLSTGGGIRPAGITVIFWHNHLCLVTVNTEGMLLMAGQTIIFITLGI
jgi:hypothetical protein